MPKGLCAELQIERGDLVLFEVEQGDVAAVVGKLALRGSESGPDKRDTDNGDHGRGT